MTMQRIAEALGIGLSTFYRKKAQFRDFGEAIKRGAAEGELIATNKLFENVKKGAPWAVCFYLKSRCGWRERDGESGAHVNVVNMNGVPSDDEQRRREEQEELIKLLSAQERRIYLALMDRAARRQRCELVIESLPMPLLGDDLEPFGADERDALRELLNSNHDENGRGPKR
jgi:hypothetical protein